LGGTEGVRDRFAVEAAATDAVIPCYWNFLLSEQDPSCPLPVAIVSQPGIGTNIEIPNVRNRPVIMVRE
jgi:hypothetical protein